MKRKRERRQLTLVMIADANSRVVRWKFPAMLVYALPCALLMMIASFILAFCLTISRSDREKAAIVDRLTGQIEMLQESLSGKDEQISELQNRIVDLSEQADQFREQLDKVKELESELNEMTGGLPTSASHLSGTPAATAFEPRGGGALPVSWQDMEALLARTRDRYNRLVAEISDSLSNITLSEQRLRQEAHLRNITPSIWPTDNRTITSGFGVRKDPFTGKPSFHSGIDIAGKLQDPVYAAAEGTVIDTGSDSTHGNYIKIDHTGGLVTLYMHLHRIMVKKGDYVFKGDKIGLLGSTGRSTGPHVHYEILQNGRSIDPKPYLEGR